MGKKSGVDWTDASWGPWRGCRKKETECLNCYGERDMKRYGWDPSTVARTKTTFRDPLKWKDPLKVFVCPWSDFFIRDADGWRDEAWAVMREASHHTYIVPTKRPGNILDRLPPDWGDGWPNVWLLVSAGTQDTADRLVPELLEVPAAVLGVSVEPLLGPMELTHYLNGMPEPCGGGHRGYVSHDMATDAEDPSLEGMDLGWTEPDWQQTIPPLNWVVIGSESGPGRRLGFDSEWEWHNAAKDLLDQCMRIGTAVFVKQIPINGKVNKDPNEWPPELRVREYPR